MEVSAVRTPAGRALAVFGAVALALAMLALAPPASADMHEPETQRLAGEDRFETAADIATDTFEAETTTDVIIAAGFRFPDSLAANGLAGLEGAPILLINEVRDEAMGSTLAALDVLDPDTLHIAGGTAAVSATVEAELETAGDWTIERYHGDDRYHTAALMADEFVDVDTVLIGTGEVAADSLAAGPLAYHAGYPLLLTRTDSLPDVTEDALADFDLDNVLILGGDRAVDDDVVDEIEGITGVDAERLAGADRAETAVAIADYALANYGEHFDVDEVSLATGWGPTRHSPHNVPVPADALAGGPYGGVHGVAILPINDVLDTVPDATCDFLDEHALEIDLLTIFGGTAAVSESVEDEAVACATIPPTQLDVTPTVDLPLPTGEDREYEADVLEHETVQVALAAAANVHVDNGDVTFDTDNGVADFGDVDAFISATNGDPTTDDPQQVTIEGIVDGDVAFTIEGAADVEETVIPVVFAGDADDNLPVDDDGVPLHDWGIGGAITFIAPETPFALEVEPDVGFNATDEDHTVTATVTDILEAPVAEVGVTFTVDGEVDDTVDTNLDGEADLVIDAPNEPAESTIVASVEGLADVEVTKFWLGDADDDFTGALLGGVTDDDLVYVEAEDNGDTTFLSYIYTDVDYEVNGEVATLVEFEDALDAALEVDVWTDIDAEITATGFGTEDETVNLITNDDNDNG